MSDWETRERRQRKREYEDRHGRRNQHRRENRIRDIGLAAQETRRTRRNYDLAE
jgi:hypothetical protein